MYVIAIELYPGGNVVRIRPSDIGSFKSSAQLRAYQDAQNIMNETDQILNAMIEVDDVSEIDFNSKTKGSVMVQGHKARVGSYDYDITGSATYDNSSKGAKEMNVTLSMGGDNTAHYSITEKRGLLGLGAPKTVIKKDDFGSTETVTINQKTGAISFDLDLGLEGGY
jgi:hypothetical protein